jgi:hypothetical protein
MKSVQSAADALSLRISELEEENRRYKSKHVQHLRILEALETVSRIIIEAENLDTMLDLVLQEFLNIFSCDRAWLLYPCDPTAETYRIPMECCRPQWPGAQAEGIDIPIDDYARRIFDLAIESSGVVRIDQQENPHFLDEEIFTKFHVRSQILMAIRPRTGKPWLLGIHHCAAPIIYSHNDCDLFKTLGNRISDGLSNLISWQNSVQLFENTEISILNEDMSEVCIALDTLRSDGVVDLRQYLEDNEQAAWDMVAMVKVVHVNEATLTLFGVKNEDEFLSSIARTFGSGAINVFIAELCAIWGQKGVETISKYRINTITNA